MTHYSDKSMYLDAISRIDDANRQDPHSEESNGAMVPKEYLYSQRMTGWLERLYPDASELLAIAARAQHICRWSIPREQFASGRQGYREWRDRLSDFHAEKTGEILHEVGYDDASIAQVQRLIRKEDLRKDPDSQRLQDIVSLVFLEFYLGEFVEKYAYDDEKLGGILRKTWKKMSPTGQQAAMSLAFPPSVQKLLASIVSPS